MNLDHASCPSDLIQIAIPSDPVEARRIQEEIEERLRRNCFSERDVFAVRLALEEAMVNAIKHGNQYDRDKRVFIAYGFATEQFLIQITDEGEGFDPGEVPDPTLVENVDRPCGRGLMLMRHYMCDVQYNERGNSVRMVKNRCNGRGR